MNKRISQPSTSPSTDAEGAAHKDESVPPRPNEGEVVSRRNIAALFGGTALGALAFAACADAKPGAGSGTPRPGDPTGQVAEALSGGNFLWVDTIVGAGSTSLRGVTGSDASTSSKPAIIVGGYSSVGDGGGGVFYWDTSSSSGDDGGTIIVPTGSTTGRWLRIYAGDVNVKWFGAKGDGNTTLSPDGTGRTVDQVAIQNALNFVGRNLPALHFGGAGNCVIVPPGQYVLNTNLTNTDAGPPLSGAALWIAQNNVKLVGAGGPPYTTQFVINGPGSGIVIESGSGPGGTLYGVRARSSEIRNIAIYAGSPAPQDGIVVHAVSVAIDDCYISGTARYGILIESGTVGGLLGVTQAPAGIYFDSNSWRLTNVFFDNCGTYSSGGDPAQGAAVYAHGSDSNAGFATSLFAQLCNVGFCDATLGGATWLACYSESAHLGYYNASPGTSTYVGCGSEDVVQGSYTLSQVAMTLGGNLTRLGPAGAPQRVGNSVSRLLFGTIGVDGATYNLFAPGGTPNSAVDVSRTVGSASSTWALAYQPFQAQSNAVYQTFSWRWTHYTNGSGPDFDPYNAPFGWTDTGNPRGPGLPFIANPLINTFRRWSYRQTQDPNTGAIILAPGANVVYLWGGVGTDNGAVSWATDPALQHQSDGSLLWPKAQTRVSLEMEFADVAHLMGADVRVVGYAFVPKYDNANPPNLLGRNIAAKIVNAGTAAVTVTLVWHFEAFVTNLDGQPA
jgi:hypothetical protein